MKSNGTLFINDGENLQSTGISFPNLFYYFSKSIEDDNILLRNFFRHYIVKLILNPNININDPKYTIEKQISNYPQICWSLFNIPETWSKLDNKFQGDLFRYIDITPSKNCGQSIIQVFYLMEKTHISDDFASIYYKKIQEFSISRVYQLYVDKTILLDRIWNECIKNKKYYEQMKFVDFLENLTTPIYDFFNDSESERLGYFLGLCCCNNTFTAQKFTNKCSLLWINYMPFCYGLMRGMLTKNNNLFIYFSSFPYALSVLSKLKNENLLSMFAYLEKLPVQETSTNKYEYDRIIEIIEGNTNLAISEEIRLRAKNIINTFFAPIIGKE